MFVIANMAIISSFAYLAWSALKLNASLGEARIDFHRRLHRIEAALGLDDEPPASC